jgi:hypothetical protein
MLDFFKKTHKVSKILISTQKNTDIVLYLFESIKTNHDDFETMAYIKTPYYHSFGKVSQKQFKIFNEDFIFQKAEFVGEEPSIDELTAHTLPIHKTYEQAKKEKYRLNLAFIYLFYWPENKKQELTEKDKNRYLNFTLEENMQRYEEEYQKATAEERKEFLNKDNFKKQVVLDKYSHNKFISIKIVLEALQKYPVLELVYNDYNESIFQKSIKFSHRSLNQFVFVQGNFDSSYGSAKSVTELVECILSKHKQKVNNSFKKEMITYIVENLVNTSQEENDEKYSLFTLNQNLLNRIIFISEFIYFSDYSWNEISKLIERFDNKEYYFNESLFFPCTSLEGDDESKYYQAFTKHLKFLKEKNFDLYAVLTNWNLYTSTMLSTSELLNEMVGYKFNPKHYKDLNRTYMFFSKKLSEGIENFEFKNFNGEKFNNNISDLTTIKNAEYTIKVISTFKELVNVGTILDNCAGSKATLDYYKEQISFIVEINEQIVFMGCIKNGQFNQLKGYKNSSPSFELFQSVFKSLQNLNFVDKIENQHLKNRYKKLYEGNLWRAMYEQECIQH